MSACSACGVDFTAPVTGSWGFKLAKDIKSLNAHCVNAGASRFAYGKERNEWSSVLAWATRPGFVAVPDATGLRRVTLTRFFSGRQQRMDRDNAIGGAKPLLDAMTKRGLIVGDAEDQVQVIYKQVRCEAEDRGTYVLIEALA